MNEYIINFTRLNGSDLMALANRVHVNLTTAPGQMDFSAVDPPATDLATAKASYQDSLNKETSVSVTIQRTERKAFLVNVLQRMAASCELIANGNMELLAIPGFEFRKTPVHSHLPPAKPGNLRLAHGSGSGMVVGKCDRPTHADSLEMQTAPNADDGPWTLAGIFTSSQNMELHGLATMTTLWARVRGIGSNGPGEWSDPATIIVT